MGARAAIAFWLALATAATTQAQTPDELHAMFEAKQVFALRDAVAHGHARLLYRGAVEASQNRIGAAQKTLRKVIQGDPHSREAYEAHDLLGNLYFRNGLYLEALTELEADRAEKPDAADVNNALPLFRALAESPDMKIVRRRSMRLMRVGDEHSALPIRINGKPVTYGFDTGAAISVMGESDAKLLGLTVKHVSTTLTEASGSDIPGFSIAMAKDLEIGGLHLQNVAFFVLQDTGEPFVNVPVGSRGLIGLPVLIAMQTVRWESGGGFVMGGHSAATASQNLLFTEQTPVIQAQVKEKTLSFSLDTGAVDTDLNESFAKKFPELVVAGTKETRPITGLGGSNTYDSVLLGPVTFRVGGLDITLKSPHVFVSHSLGKFDGNMGNDILNQAKAVTLNFRAMTLKLE